MRFDVQDDAPFPRELVFRTHRDALPEIAPRMTEVERVERRGRAVTATGVITQTHRWVGHPSALPLLLRPLVPADMLRWEDESRWDPSTWTCSWRVTVPALGPMADITGTHTYTETPTGCRIALEGTFDFHPERVPQLTLPPGAVPIVERFVVALIVPLVTKSGRAVVAYLQDHPDRR